MMKQLFTLFLAALSLQMFASGAFVPGEVLVQLKPGVDPQSVVSEVVNEVGIRPQFHLVQEVSKPMRVWLFAFDANTGDTRDMVKLLNHTKGVAVAQVNHIITERLVPNDPFFGQQWYHVNSNDKDIDSDLAWDITTGGTTALGDEIVVCIVEPSGANWQQADIVDNHWTNTDEIADNGIDDDANGYVDDVDGWNIAGNDNIGNGDHGTSVSSMIGGKGNNNLGITGVNWDVKLMEVQLGNVNEANVIAAYTYPMIMRKLYNETAGNKGAFVVATNSSWGTDGGQPADAPLWCAMYDSLGYYGVISCGATANNNVNIDQVGDLPTACPSNYLISVTATNTNDVRTFSGYGATTIDLGAPGESVYLANNNGYGNTSGTSFASPCVAGAVALMYSAPCTSLMPIAYSDPALAASMVRGYILDGVDAVSNLSTECVTGGRLNLNNSLQLLLGECSASGCIVPFAIHVDQQTGTLIYDVSWGQTSSMTAFNLRYRVVGTTDWTVVSNLSTNQYTLPALLACEAYELQVQSNCDAEQSDWSNSLIWTTDGCCENPGTLVASNITATSVVLTWTPVLAASSYYITLNTTDGGQNIYFAGNATTYEIAGLDSCTTYQALIGAVCEDVPAGGELFSIYFNTVGCGSCEDLGYCTVSGNTDYEWISGVQFGQINNTTVSDNGYGDYLSMTTPVEQTLVYPITLTPGFASGSYTEYFKVWIDYNSNGVFDEPNELAYDAGAGSQQAVNGNITIPADAVTGGVRMRVGMSYVGFFGGGNPPVSCGDLGEGEAEDYCLTILPHVGIEEISAQAFGIFPNPASEMVQFSIPEGITVSKVEVIDMAGQVVMSDTFRRQWNVSSLATGVYIMRFTTNQGHVVYQNFVVSK